MEAHGQGMSRRSFLGGAGMLAVGAGATALGLTGCSPSTGSSSASSANSASSDSDEFALREADETFETDVIVVGGGMGGMSAALEASDHGASVILLEAASEVGGGTAYAEGMFGAGTKLQEELGITNLHPKQVLNIEYDFQNYNVNTKMWERVAADSADDIDWLMEKGVVFQTVTGMGNTELCWHVYEDAEGKTAIGYMKKAAEQAGVDIRTNTRATTLITEDNRVIGVQAKTENGYADFKGKAVILACGGFSANEDYVEKCSNFEPGSYKYLGVPFANGDGIRMASKITGERPKNTTICIVGLGVPEFDMTAHLGICGAMEATNMWVNSDAVRFAPESLSREPSVCGNVVKCQNTPVYSLFDQKAYDRFKTEGMGTGYGMYVPPGTIADKLDDEVEQYAGNAHWAYADTIEEVAQKMGLDPGTLKDTVDTYNAMCEAGEDTDYGKPADYLMTLDQGPYYIFEIQPIVLCTMGGIRINADCQVCNKDMEPVPGLYGASSDVSGFQGETYGITISGSCQAIACWSGRVAGRSAAASLS